MRPNEFQKLAARTRCPQGMALAKLSDNVFHNAQQTQFPAESGDESGVVPPQHSGSMLMHGLIGVTGEVGELASAVEKYVWYNQHFDRNNVVKELGDVLWYVAEMCDAVDIDMEQVMETVINKLRTRYPDKYSDERALEENRDRVAEGDTVGPSKGVELCENETRPTYSNVPVPFDAKNRELQERAADDGVFYEDN